MLFFIHAAQYKSVFEVAVTRWYGYWQWTSNATLSVYLLNHIVCTVALTIDCQYHQLKTISITSSVYLIGSRTLNSEKNGPSDQHIKPPITLPLILCDVQGWAIQQTYLDYFQLSAAIKLLENLKNIIISFPQQANREQYTLSSKIEPINHVFFLDITCVMSSKC